MKNKTTLSYLWKIPVCGIFYFIGLSLGGIILPLIGFQTPEIPTGTDANMIALCFLEGSMILAYVLSILSKKLALKGWARWSLLAGLTWIVGAAGMVLESYFFMDTGAVSSLESSLFTMLNFLLPSLFLTGAVTWLFPPEISSNNFHHNQPPGSSTWKLALALIAYPVIYICFGLLVKPYISTFYLSGMYELTIPSWGQMIPLQILRSGLFLGICYPVIRCWKGSPLKLWVSLGSTFFILTAFMAVITSYWFPWKLRLFHGLELLADAMVYIGILIYLFTTNDSWVINSSHNKKNVIRSAVVTILLVSVINLGCTSTPVPQDQYYTPPDFSVSLSLAEEQRIQSELAVFNGGDSPFPADSSFDGNMVLWDQNGVPRARIDAPKLPEIQPGESLTPTTLVWDLDPGTYFIVWGSPKYGGVIDSFTVKDGSGQNQISRSTQVHIKPVELSSNAFNAGQIGSFSIAKDGSLIISGESPLPDHGRVFAFIHNQDGVVDMCPQDHSSQIADGRWRIVIPSGPEECGVNILPDTNYRIILFSGDLSVPPSEPFDIFISPPVQN